MANILTKSDKLVCRLTVIWIYLFITLLIKDTQGGNPVEYIFGFITGKTDISDVTPSVQLYNPTSKVVDVDITSYTPSGAVGSTLRLKPSKIRIFDLNKYLTMSSSWKNIRKSVRITSPVHLNVIAIYGAAGTGDMQLVSSVAELDRHYVAMPHCTTPYASCQVLVVATTNDTVVKFRFPRPLWNISSDIVDGLFSIRLHKYQLYRIQAQNLEGVIISANAPISAFTGENITMNGKLHADHTTTEMVNYWGKLFILVKNSKMRDIVKIIACTNGTDVTLSGSCDNKIRHRSLGELQTSTESLACSYMLVQSNFPVQVAHIPSGSNGDFSLYYAPAVDYFSSQYIVNTIEPTTINMECKITLIIKSSSKSGLRVDLAALPSTAKWKVVERTNMVYTRLSVQHRTTITLTHQDGQVFGGNVICGTRYQTLATSLRPGFDQNFYHPSQLDLSAMQCPTTPNTVDDITTESVDVTTKPVDITTQSEDVTPESADVTTKPVDVSIESKDVTTELADITTISFDVRTSNVDATTDVEDVTTESVDVNTDSIDVTVQTVITSPPATTDIVQSTTSSDVISSRICRTCICKPHRHLDIKDLGVDKVTTVRWIRSQTCATDNRTSSVCMGCVAILIFVAIAIMVVLIDTMTLCKLKYRKRTGSYNVS